MKIRQDAWTEEDDLLLAETVLRHIREGSTQLNAFDEVGDILNRTSAACGFRWNAVIRERYDQAIELAKKQRKERKRAQMQQEKQAKKAVGPAGAPAPVVQVTQQPPVSQPAAAASESVQPRTTYAATREQMRPQTIASFDDVIAFLQSMKDSSLQDRQNSIENERLRQENEELMAEKERLEKKLEKLEREFEQMEDDYQGLLRIMDRARRIALKEEEEQIPAATPPAFRMDRNGNLEKIVVDRTS